MDSTKPAILFSCGQKVKANVIFYVERDLDKSEERILEKSGFFHGMIQPIEMEWKSPDSC
ncbi:hypothetical protein [Methylobacillus flagellatus]|uniref:hypothetical protein n=1 Tax=Methylobacillus flagellatus TaxID=405 RepID=UPI0002DDD898|nr:hypothetical protein [Methylobacillus flagellatus]